MSVAELPRVTRPDAPWVKHYPPDTKVDYRPEPDTLVNFFGRCVAEYGPREAVEQNDVALTYAELGRRAARMAHALRGLGAGPGVTVALYMPNTPWHPVAFFGILLTGARVTHLSPLDAPRELEHKLTDSGARIAITLGMPHFTAQMRRQAAEGHVDRALICDDAAFGGPQGDAAPEDAWAVSAAAAMAAAPDDDLAAAVAACPATPEDLALLQYTGGTTGKPKAAMLRHRNMMAAVGIYLNWQDENAPPGEEEVTLSISPLFHIMGLVSTMMRRLGKGSKVILHQRFEVARVLDDIERKGVTSFGGVPTLWIAILHSPGVESRDLSSLKVIGSGGAPLPIETFRGVKKLLGLNLRGGWGMTETCPAGTSIPAGAGEEKIASIGVPLAGLDMKIVDVDDPARDLPPGETGEIAIRGPNVTEGYWNRPEETAKSYHDGWFLTGDIGKMDADGFFYLHDRKTDMILSGGFNVYPQAIENAIHEHPDVAEVMVIGVPDEYRGESAKAYVVLHEGAAGFDLDGLRDFLADRLGRHELPAALEFREDLPRTAVGKYSRRLLRQEVLGR